MLMNILNQGVEQIAFVSDCWEVDGCKLIVFRGWAGTIDQRTQLTVPWSFTKPKAFKLLNVLLANPEDIG